MNEKNKESGLNKLFFSDKNDKNLFNEWLKLNVNIIPVYELREKWNLRKGNFLVENNKMGDGKNRPKGYNLFLPENLRINELPGIIIRVNKLTYNENIPEDSSINSLELEIKLTIATLIKKYSESMNDEKRDYQSTIKRYIDLYNQYFPDKEINGPIGIDFYDKVKNEIKKIEETDNIRYETRYKIKLEKLEQNKSSQITDVQIEDELSVNIQNLTLESIFEKGSMGLYDYLKTFTQKKYDDVINNAFNEGKRVFKITNNGLQELKFGENIKEGEEINITDKNENLEIMIKYPKSHFNKIEKNLKDYIGIDKLKNKLDNVRKNGDIREISKVELECMDKIIKAIYSYPRGENGFSTFPENIYNSNTIICVGKSILAHIFLEKLKIKHYGLDIYNHSALSVYTTNGNKYYFDPTNYSNSINITNSLVKNKYKYGDYTYINSSIIDENIRLIREQNINENLTISLLDNLGNNYLKRGQNEYARKIYLKILTIDENNVSALMHLGNIYFTEKKYVEWEKYYTKSINVDPLHVFHLVGFKYYEIKEYTKAEYFYFESINRNPERENAWFLLGYIYDIKGVKLKKDLCDFVSYTLRGHLYSGDDKVKIYIYEKIKEGKYDEMRKYVFDILNKK